LFSGFYGRPGKNDLSDFLVFPCTDSKGYGRICFSGTCGTLGKDQIILLIGLYKDFLVDGPGLNNPAVVSVYQSVFGFYVFLPGGLYGTPEYGCYTIF